MGLNPAQSLCKGRRVVFGAGRDRWVSFKYERLPNFRYWCGLLSHDAKDYDRWISGNGTLETDPQEFRDWSQAHFFNPLRKSVVTVAGYENSTQQGEYVPPRQFHLLEKHGFISYKTYAAEN